jgi:hypothetical protein
MICSLHKKSKVNLLINKHTKYSNPLPTKVVVFLKKIMKSKTVIGRLRPHAELGVMRNGAAVNTHHSQTKLPVPSLSIKNM